MKTILLTGGTGYIGSHGAVALLEKNYKVIILDNLSNSKKEVIDDIKQITGKIPKFYCIDLKNKIDIKRVFEENSIDFVIHFAGSKAVGESCSKPFYYYENNLIGSLNLFKIMDDFGVKNIIFSSSATVYDPSIKPPFIESDKTGNTVNPYGTTKLIIENILRDLSNHKGFNVINLRYFNPTGAHKSGLIGENPNDIPNNLLPFIMKVALGELAEIKVFGDNYDTIDGTGERDYIHVVDLIDGHIKALKFIEKNKIKKGLYEVFNLGTGKPTSVLEMIKITEKVVGKKLDYSIVEKREGDVAISYCISKKTEEILDWKTKYSIKDSIKDSWNFIKNKQINE